MQKTILVQKQASRKYPEQAIESIRRDENVLSIVVTSYGTAIDAETFNCEQLHRESTSERTQFCVTDLLSGTRYTVAPWKQLRQISFPSGREEIVVMVNPNADVVEIAGFVGEHMEAILRSN